MKALAPDRIGFWCTQPLLASSARFTRSSAIYLKLPLFASDNNFGGAPNGTEY